jgi:competence protein ComEC
MKTRLYVMSALGGLVCAGLLGLSSAAAQTMRVHFVDVGQGASTLVEFPCAAVLIDAGGEKNAEFNGTAGLITYLDEFFAERSDLNNTLAAVILTHPHKDHTLGVPAVLGKFRVLNAITNGMETGSGRAGQIALHKKVETTEQTPQADDDVGYKAVWLRDIPKGQGLTGNVIDPVNCGSIDPKITALWGRVGSELAWSKTQLENANNHSVAIKVAFGKSSILISGDLEEAALKGLVAHYRGTSVLDVDVVQVNHHGSHNGSTDEFLRATTPDFAVIQMGPNDRKLAWTAWAYGHPRKVVVDLLQRRVAKARPSAEVMVATGVKAFVPVNVTRAVYGTGWDGAIILEADANGVWRPFDAVADSPLVNLNTATVEELMSLPMIGRVRANAIVQHRSQSGPFQSVNDLLNVERIKGGTVDALRHLVTTGN